MGRLRFRVLGTVEIEHDGVPVPLPGRKPRTALAALLLHAPKAVPVDSLIDALWGDEPPPTARTALQVNISFLRRILAGDADARIETTPGAYRIHVDPESIDVVRFRALSASGREHAAAGDWERSASLLRDALDLWRGSPLSDVDPPEELVPDISELEETHVTTFEAWVEAKLTIAQHADVLEPLEKMRVIHPIRERLHGLSALALYRAGRQAEAVECLAHLRRTLSSELGVEPGSEIQRVETRMLERDESVTRRRSHARDGRSSSRWWLGSVRAGQTPKRTASWPSGAPRRSATSSKPARDRSCN
jgi:DNA-binding SARP family transcriptional activator